MANAQQQQQQQYYYYYNYYAMAIAIVTDHTSDVAALGMVVLQSA